MSGLDNSPGGCCCHDPYDFYFARDYGDDTPARQLALVSYLVDPWSHDDWTIASPWSSTFEESGYQREVRQTLAVPASGGELVYFVEEVIDGGAGSGEKRAVLSCYNSNTELLVWSVDLLTTIPADRFPVFPWHYGTDAQDAGTYYYLHETVGGSPYSPFTIDGLLPTITTVLDADDATLNRLRVGGTYTSGGVPGFRANYFYRAACSDTVLFVAENEPSNQQIVVNAVGSATAYPSSGWTATDWTATGAGIPKPPSSAGLWRLMAGAAFAYPQSLAARGYVTGGSVTYNGLGDFGFRRYQIECDLQIDIGRGTYNPATTIVGSVTTDKAINVSFSTEMLVFYTPSPETFANMDGVAFVSQLEFDVEAYDENANGDACYAFNYGVFLHYGPFSQYNSGDNTATTGGGLLFARDGESPVEIARASLSHDYTTHIATRKLASASGGSGALTERHAVVRSTFAQPGDSKLTVYDDAGNEEWSYSNTDVEGFAIWATSENWLFVKARASVSVKTSIDLTGYSYDSASLETRPGGIPTLPEWDWWLISWDGDVWIPARAYGEDEWIEEHDELFAYLDHATDYRHADLVSRATHPNARGLSQIPTHPAT